MVGLARLLATRLPAAYLPTARSFYLDPTGDTGMHLGILLLLAQGATQTQAPVTQVEVVPARAEVPIGQTLRLSATARDSSGRVVDVPIRWMGHGEGSVDSTGLLKAGYAGYVHVFAVAAADSTKPVLGQAVIRVLPLPASRIEIQPAPSKLLAGTRLTLTGLPFSAQGDRRNDPVSFSSSAPRVASVTADGRLSALAPGQATITARSGAARGALTLRVVPNTAARLAVEPALKTVKTGDVVRFTLQAQNAKGRAIADLPVRWAVNAVAPSGVAQVDEHGAFVAETPGKYTVTGLVGDRTADAVIQVEPRRVGRGMVVQGRVPLAFRAAEVWAHPAGKCVYLSTISDRVYAIDVADPAQPRIVDSMMTNARLVNDVMTTEDGKYGVFSREGASDRKNGIVVFDAIDPCHPKPISDYTETVSGGVHSSYCLPGPRLPDRRRHRLDAGHRHPGSLRQPKEVARWQTEQTEAGRYVHDIDGQGRPGVPLLLERRVWSSWTSATASRAAARNPKLVSQFKYDLDETYARVDQI